MRTRASADDQEMMMTISVNGAGAASPRMQMARLFSEIQSGNTTGSSTTGTSSTIATSSTGSSAGDLGAQLQSVFQSAMSSDTMGGLLQAQGDEGRVGPPSLSDIDSDGNGGLSKTEFESFASSKTGITASASPASDTSKADEMFSKMDTNGDGSASAGEKAAFDKKMEANRPSGPPLSGMASADFGSMSDTGSQSTADMMQQLLAALQSYASASSSTSSNSAATTSTSTTSVAA